MTKDEVIGRLVSGSKEIEGVLESLGGQGKGLHGKALSLQSHLGSALVKKIQFLATIRNKAVHEDQFQDVPFEAWTRAKDQVLSALAGMDPVESGHVAALPAARGPLPPGARVGRALGSIVVLVAFAIIAVVILRNYQSNRRDPPIARDSSKGVSAGDDPPLWSVKNPAHAHQVFPWREEQAAFIARGEKGALPSETLWEVVSPVRPTQRKGKTVLEVAIRLGGGKSRGKLLLSTASMLGTPETSAHGFEVELEGQKPAGRISGELIHANGRMFDGFRHPFECRREVPTGCGEWQDNGARLVALSTVSFGNALKLIDAR